MRVPWSTPAAERAAAPGHASARPDVPGTPAPVPAGPEPEAPPRRLTRRSDGRMVAGVAAGIAEHLGVDVLVVRAVFVVLVFAGGAGFLAYGALWVVVPLGPEVGPLPPRRAALERDALLAFASLGVGLLLLGQLAGLGLPPGVLWPVLLGGAGLVILWKQADEDQRARWAAAALGGQPGLAPLARTLLGIVLVVLGGVLFLVTEGQLTAARDGLVATAVVVAGLALVTGPFWLRTVRELSDERRARIREQERAEIAAHVHDSVLHTLALIQRHVDDPREVQRLARGQERALRTWLYRPETAEAGTLTAAVERLAAEVEDAHGVPFDVVAVGDASLDAGLTALLAAAREAMVNAAKYAGPAPVSVYVEVEPAQVTLFVRDRGPGFDLDAVPEDRLGVRESVVGRMRRNGGQASVRPGPGDEGTEVELSVPWAGETPSGEGTAT